MRYQAAARKTFDHAISSSRHATTTRQSLPYVLAATVSCRGHHRPNLPILRVAGLEVNVSKALLRQACIVVEMWRLLDDPQRNALRMASKF